MILQVGDGVNLLIFWRVWVICGSECQWWFLLDDYKLGGAKLCETSGWGQHQGCASAYESQRHLLFECCDTRGHLDLAWSLWIGWIFGWMVGSFLPRWAVPHHFPWRYPNIQFRAKFRIAHVNMTHENSSYFLWTNFNRSSGGVCQVHFGLAMTVLRRANKQNGRDGWQYHFQHQPRPALHCRHWSIHGML